MKQTVDFNIKGMRCDACANRLHNALASVPGVEQVSISFKEGRAQIVFETTERHVNQLAVAIQEAGFEAPSGCP